LTRSEVRMNNSIAEQMVDFLNEWPDKPVRIQLGALPKDAPGMMMRQLSGAVCEKAFVDGSFVGRWPFAVFVRTGGGDARERLDADGVLHALAGWLAGADMPDLGDGRAAVGIEMAQLPAIAAAFNSGVEDYMAVFSLKFSQSSSK